MLFDKEKSKIMVKEDDVDITKACINEKLSAVGFDKQHQFFYMTIDRLMFESPIATIKTVLDTHGFVSNIENILSCLDSFTFGVNASYGTKEEAGSERLHVKEYLPCVRFELPQKNCVGEMLQSFYDEISKYESKSVPSKKLSDIFPTNEIAKKSVTKELDQLKIKNKDLEKKISLLTQKLEEQNNVAKQMSSGSSGSKNSLPGNTRICRVEHVDLKKRIIKVKSVKKIIEIPTHILDRVPNCKVRCLVTFGDDEKTPVGVLFFDSDEIGNIEKRTADLLYVEGDTFKARDSMRNEFQVKAVNAVEEETIKSLRRGMKMHISIADGYVVRFSLLEAVDEDTYQNRIHEQLVVYDIGRNQLLEVTPEDVPSNHTEVDE